MSNNFGRRVTDAEFNRIFEEKHGAEARSYYSRGATVVRASHWSAIQDAIIGRGRQSHTEKTRGAE